MKSRTRKQAASRARKQAHEDKRRDKRKAAAQGKRTATKLERQARTFAVAQGRVNVFQANWRERVGWQEVRNRIDILFSYEVEEGDKAA